MWPGRAAEHVLGLGADGDDDLAAARGLVLHRDHRGLVEHDALVAHVDQRVGRAQVDRQIAGEIAAQAFEHGAGETLCGGRPEKRPGNLATDRTFHKATVYDFAPIFPKLHRPSTTMSLTRRDIDSIAHLARLALSEAEIPVYIDSLSRILELRRANWIAPTRPASTPMAHPLPGLTQRLRPDVVTEADRHELYQRNAPQVAGRAVPGAARSSSEQLHAHRHRSPSSRGAAAQRKFSATELARQPARAHRRARSRRSTPSSPSRREAALAAAAAADRRARRRRRAGR